MYSKKTKEKNERIIRGDFFCVEAIYFENRALRSVWDIMPDN